MSNSNEINWKKSFYQALFIYILSMIGGAIIALQVHFGIITEQEEMKYISDTNIASVILGMILISSIYRPNAKNIFAIWLFLAISSIPNVFLFNSNLVTYVDAVGQMAFYLISGNLFGILVNVLITFALKFFKKII
tara:strand:- start:1 stop:408 length:408 start_codon:yes stop_codon:yes gene_type:complete